MRESAIHPIETTQSNRYEEYAAGLVHDWLRTVSALGALLVPTFLVLDYFTMPEELLHRFAVYRIAVTAFAAVEYVLISRTPPSRWSVLHGYAFSLMVGGMIVAMTVDLGGFNSSYYAGLILVLVGVNLLLPWRAIHSAINCVLVLGMYAFANTTWGGAFQTQTLINNLFFLAGVALLAVAITALRHRLFQREFEARAGLLEANQSLDRSRSELKDARDALWCEMEVAKRIQTALLPTNRQLGRYKVAGLMRPADEVGGDYYEMFETRAGEHWVAIGDVSGHGVESGLVMMMTQTSILTLVNDAPGRRPSEVFRTVNSVLRENIVRLQTQRFMTLNVIRLHPDRMTVAGKHQDLLIYRRRGRKVDAVVNRGSWVGILDDTAGMVPDMDVPLDDGDTVLLFTDGVTEATNASGEMYGQDRLEQAFARVASLPLEEALRALLLEVERFRARQDDDVTMMLLRRERAAA
jgi:serine phosphatase RsbU (regulator of sigma subunit)